MFATKHKKKYTLQFDTKAPKIGIQQVSRFASLPNM
jgi:hypothetical protein